MNKNKQQTINTESKLYNLFDLTEFEPTLQELFDKRLNELQIPFTTALTILNIESRTLKGILSGKQKLVDFTNLIKIADFLQISKQHLIRLYLTELEKNHPDDIQLGYDPSKISFIKNNFDLAALKKDKFIDSITDYAEIEKKILSYFGLKHILDYKKPTIEVAFSAGLIQPKNDLARSTWISSAQHVFEGLNNPFPYDREQLINFFHEIRWHCMDVEKGLINVIKILYKMGVTIIYLEPSQSVHLRGATLAINKKPCIVITNYRNYYPSLWFALIHELFHVLFDWEEILISKYHVSDPESESFTVAEKEAEADEFAREYLLPTEKLNKVSASLYEKEQIDNFARRNHVHPSFIYVFYAYSIKKPWAWGLANQYNPDITLAIKDFINYQEDSKSIPNIIRFLKLNVFYFN